MKRVLSYAGIILLAFLLQNNVFAVCPIIDATPNILLILTFSIGFIRGTSEGMTVGFFCGLLMDFAFGSIIGYYAMIYLVVGYVTGMIGQMFYIEFLNMPLLLCVLSDFIYNMYIYTFGFLIRGRTALGSYMTQVILPEVVYTALLTLLVYPLVLKLNERLSASEKRSAKRFV